MRISEVQVICFLPESKILIKMKLALVKNPTEIFLHFATQKF